MSEYCPNCKSRLYPIDTEFMKKYHVCSSCVTYDPKYRTNEHNELTIKPKTKGV